MINLDINKKLIKNDMSAEERHVSFRRAFWQSSSLLNNLNIYNFEKVPQEKKDSIHDEMWINLVAEYDAIHLSRRLRRKKDKFSSKFMAFEHIWLLDEMNHYGGLRKIYCAMYGFEESKVHKNVVARKPNFTEIKEFLNDELVLCACFAYDELASTRGYADAFPLYDSFGIAALSRWIRLVARDELYHSLNAQLIIKTLHAARLLDVTDILRKVVFHDSTLTSGYKATFLFDHDHDPGNNPFNNVFLKKCANDICSYLCIPPSFEE